MPTERIDIVVSERGSRTVRRNISDIGKGATRAEGAVQLLRRTLGALGGALVLVNAVRTLAQFGQEMSTVRAVTGATQKQFEALSRSAKDLGATTRFTATQAAEGMTFLARAGFDTTEVLDSVGDVLTLAQAGALDLGRAADIASNVLKGFNLEADETVRIVDVLAKTAASSNTNVEQLGDAMSFVAPAAAAVGVDVERASAAVGVLSDAGIQATRAGTGLRQIFVQLLKPTGAAKAEIRGMGLTVDDLNVQSRGLVPVLETLRDKQIGLSEAANLVGVRQASSLLVLTKNIPRLKELIGLNEGAAGTAREMARVMDDNLNGALLRVASAAESVVLAVGQIGADNALRNLLESLARGLRFLSSNIENTVSALGVLAGAFLALKLPAIIGLFKSLTLVILANPFVALATAITVATSALVLMQDEIALTKDGTVTLADGFDAAGRTIGESLTAAVNSLGFSFRDFDEISKTVVRNFSQGLIFVLANVNGTVKAVEAAFDDLPSALLNIAKLAFNGFLRVLAFNLNQSTFLIQKFLKFLGVIEKDAAPLFDFKFLEIKMEEGGNAIGEAFKRGVAETLDEVVTSALQRKIDNELASVKKRTEKSTIKVVTESEATAGDSAAVKPPKVSVEFKDFLRDLEREGILLQLNNKERSIREALFKAEEAAGKPLTAGQKEQVSSLVEQNLSLEKQRGILDEIRGPQEVYKDNIAAINALLSRNAITQEEANQKTRESRIALLETQRTAGAGAERFFLKISDSAENAARQIEDVLGTAFRGVTDSLVEFVNTGKLSINDLANEIQQKLLRGAIEGLLVSFAQALGVPGASNNTGGLIGSLFGGSGSGGGGGGAGSGIASFIGGLFSSGAQNGADFTVSSANTVGSLPGVDNRLLTLPVKDGERVQVTPQGKGGGGGMFNIEINVNGGNGSPNDIGKAVGQAAAEAAVVLQQANVRNN